MKNIKILALVFFSLNAYAMDGELEASQKNPSLNPGLTADEVARIQGHMYSKYVWQMGIMGLNFEEMAHGNTELTDDLKILYQSRNYRGAMLTFHGLCQKWGFDTSFCEGKSPAG